MVTSGSAPVPAPTAGSLRWEMRRVSATIDSPPGCGPAPPRADPSRSQTATDSENQPLVSCKSCTEIPTLCQQICFGLRGISTTLSGTWDQAERPQSLLQAQNPQVPRANHSALTQNVGRSIPAV